MGLQRNILLKTLLWVVTATFLLPGCAIAPYIQIDVLAPATIAFPSTVNRLGVLDRTAYNTPDTTLADRAGDKTFLPIHIEVKEISKPCVNGLLSALQNSPRFEFTQLPEEVLNVNDMSSNLSQQEWQQLEEICRDSLVDALVVLKYVDYYDYISIYLNEEGEKSKYYSIIFKSAWRIYDPSEQIIINDYKHTDTTTYIVGDEFYNYNFLPDADRAVQLQEVAWHSGNDYGHRIAPQWMEVNRKYYVWPSDASTQASEDVSLNKWDEAAAIWRTETASKKRNRASQACFNMALASEIMDKYDLALYWAQKSQELKPRYSTAQYIDILKERVKTKAILDKQME